MALKYGVLEDHYGFILHHRVMEQESDDKIAVAMVEECKDKFSSLDSCSFDKGFHSPTNQRDLQNHLDTVILPRKGRLSSKDKEQEYSPDFIKARHHNLNLLKKHEKLKKAI